ncbi:hypothetical protein DdX_18052 [Ditylenchus destructor]|uniref:Uncharacterized protein n=1 Tax=Ditylenchus destructor TaxID=166010 RepID=A0AAD4MQ86_9BILA|nr:hypothetical protein DdX_18052 [Ditylenchus destructor]
MVTQFDHGYSLLWNLIKMPSLLWMGTSFNLMTVKRIALHLIEVDKGHVSAQPMSMRNRFVQPIAGSTLNQNCIARVTNVVTSVLTKLDVLMSRASMNVTPRMASRLLKSLNSLTKSSQSDIDFKSGESFAVQRKSVNCSMADTAQEWPIMKGVIRFPDNLATHQNFTRIFIEVPRKTVCNESEKQEFIIVYYMFHNPALFSTNDNERNPCEPRIHVPEQATVVSATLLKKWNMEEVHQISVDGEHKIMARIVYPAEAVTTPLHGSVKLAYWAGTNWVISEVAETRIFGNYYQYDVGHLTDFTLIVDGLEMDPILCNSVLNQFSITLNFFSFSVCPISNVMLLRVFMPGFFTRKDSFCWVRPDYVVPAVVVPLSFVVFNAVIGLVKISMRTLPQEKVSGVSSQASVVTATVSIVSSSSSDKVDESSTSNDGKTTRNCLNKMVLLLCMQLMLGAPWDWAPGLRSHKSSPFPSQLPNPQALALIYLTQRDIHEYALNIFQVIRVPITT